MMSAIDVAASTWVTLNRPGCLAGRSPCALGVDGEGGPGCDPVCCAGRQRDPVRAPLQDGHIAHGLDVAHAEELAVDRTLHLRVLVGPYRSHLDAGPLEHIPIGDARFGGRHLAAQEEAERTVRRPLPVGLAVFVLVGALVITAACNQDIAIGHREPACGRIHVPAQSCQHLGGELSGRGQHVVVPEVRVDPARALAERIPVNRPGMAAIEDHRNVRRLLAQAQQPQVDLVIRNVAVGVRAAAAVVGDDRLVEPVRLVALTIPDLRAVPTITQHDNIVRLCLVGQGIHCGQDCVAGRLFVRQQSDVLGCKAKTICENALQQQGIVDAAVKLKPRCEVRILVDADEERTLPGCETCLHNSPP